ncbi:aldehyde dehydrogenase family protein [Sarocladium implicatum]|nr:aldehyde dehydrogenase family protein [Sarocladium implicatum]
MAASDEGSANARNRQPIVILAGCEVDGAVEHAHRSLYLGPTTVHILVHESVHQIFVESLLDTLEEASHQQRDWNRITSSLPDFSALRRVRQLLKAAQAAGATVRTGTIPSSNDIVSAVAYCRNSTVVDHVRPDMKLFGESVTGPLAVVSGFSEADVAVGWIKDSFPGHGSIVFGKNNDQVAGFLSGLTSGPLSIQPT